MSDSSLDELGPVDYLVVEFRQERATSRARWRRSLVALVDAGTIRVIDVPILTKNADGTADAMEPDTRSWGAPGRRSAASGAAGRGRRDAARR